MDYAIVFQSEKGLDFCVGMGYATSFYRDNFRKYLKKYRPTRVLVLRRPANTKTWGVVAEFPVVGGKHFLKELFG